MKTRLIKDIAEEIEKDWKDVWFGARPYVEAMKELDTVDSYFGLDSARMVILYFLSNAQYWRGPTAQRIKEELKGMIKEE